MNSTNVVKIRTKVLRNLDSGMEDWMKAHSIQDLRDIVFEMYNRGEDISDMVDLVHEMDEIALHAHVIREDNVMAIAEYDILTYVDGVEHDYALV